MGWFGLLASSVFGSKLCDETDTAAALVYASKTWLVVCTSGSLHDQPFGSRFLSNYTPIVQQFQSTSALFAEGIGPSRDVSHINALAFISTACAYIAQLLSVTVLVGRGDISCCPLPLTSTGSHRKVFHINMDVPYYSSWLHSPHLPLVPLLMHISRSSCLWC